MPKSLLAGQQARCRDPSRVEGVRSGRCRVLSGPLWDLGNGPVGILKFSSAHAAGSPRPCTKQAEEQELYSSNPSEFELGTYADQ